MRPTTNRHIAELQDRLRTDRRLQVIVSLVCAVFVAVVITTHIVSLQTSIQQWTGDNQVLVAISDIAPGDALTNANTTSRPIPHSITPRNALTSIRDETVATSLIVSGQVISEHHIGVATSMTPVGWKTVALPEDVMLPLAAIGANVDVVIDAHIVVNNAILITTATEIHSATIAVPEQHAPAVAIAAQRGALTLVGS